MIIYKATNLINGKIYIGQTIQNFDRYKQCHINNALSGVDIKKGKRRPFYDAIRKYGAENFSWCIECICTSKKELCEKEIYYIKFYETYEKGYNATKGGEGGFGNNKPKSEEHKQRISLSLIGTKRSIESCKKQSQSIKGKNHPLFGIGHKQSSIEKMKKAKKGIKNPNGKRYLFISPDGNEFIVEGQFNKFCAEHHLWHNAMTNVHRGIKPSHRGWLCSVIEEKIIDK